MSLAFFKKLLSPFTAFKEKRRLRSIQKTEQQDIENLSTKKVSAWYTSAAFKHLDRLTRWKMVDEATHQPKDPTRTPSTPNDATQNLTKT